MVAVESPEEKGAGREKGELVSETDSILPVQFGSHCLNRWLVEAGDEVGGAKGKKKGGGGTAVKASGDPLVACSHVTTIFPCASLGASHTL